MCIIGVILDNLSIAYFCLFHHLGCIRSYLVGEALRLKWMRLWVVSGIVWIVTLQLATRAITAYSVNNSQLLLIMLYTTFGLGSWLFIIGTFLIRLLQKLLVLLISRWSSCWLFLLWLFQNIRIVTSIWILHGFLEAFNSVSTALNIGTSIVWILAPKLIYTTFILTLFSPLFFFLTFNLLSLSGWHPLDRPSWGPTLLLARRFRRLTVIIRFFLKLIFSRLRCALSTLLHRAWFIVFHLHTNL